MLITQKVEVKWNSKIKKHYVDKGYIFTKMKDSFLVNPIDLTNGSNLVVKVKCDYCNNEYEVVWHHRITSNDKINKDCCYNMECRNLKRKESMILSYGEDNVMKVDEFKEKNKNTNIEKYGVSNVFSNDDIKEKIYNTNIERYGGKSSMCSEKVREKATITNIKRYGETSHMKTEKYRNMFRGENNPVWKGDNAIYGREDRYDPKYRKWRLDVFERDNYTCQCCEKRGVNLNAHHIHNWKDYESLRFDFNNGITLCEECHRKFHIIYGKNNNNEQQLKEFLQNNG